GADPRILELLDGSHTTVDISERLLFSRFEVSRTVWRLLEANQLRKATADELIQAARRLDPDLHRARVKRILQRARARLKLNDSRLDEIAELFVRVQAVTAAIAILLVRARTLLAEGSDETAYALVRRAGELDPHHLGMLQTQAEIHEARGERDLEAKVLTTLAERCAAAEKYDDAVEFASRVARLNPDSPLLDRSFATYCQKAGTQKRGADVLSDAAGFRTSASRAAVLYDAILLLDPSRGDIRKAKSRQKSSSHRARLLWAGGGLVVLAALAFLGQKLLAHIDGQRLEGRLESAEQLLRQGEARLAEADLRSILDLAPEGGLRDRVDRLLVQARSELAQNQQERQNEWEHLLREKLSLVQDRINVRDYRGALDLLLELGASKDVQGEIRTTMHAKGKLLISAIEAEHSDLVRLASQFLEPDNDTELLDARETFAQPFSPERETAFLELLAGVGEAPATPLPKTDLDRMQKLGQEALAALRSVRPGLASVESRIARNEALDLLSDDYQETRQAEAQGRYEIALGGYDRLLRDYGDGPLTLLFSERRAAVAAVLEALAEARSLVDQGDVATAHARMRRCAGEWPDLGVERAVGLPVRISTLPSGATLLSEKRSLGTAPTTLWVKAGSPTTLEVSVPGFEAASLTVTAECEPVVSLELRRTARFEVGLRKVVDVTPTVAADRILVGARDGVLYRLDLRSGAILDRQSTGSLSGISAPPLLMDDVIVVALGEGELQAVDAESLLPRWSRPLRAALAGAPVAFGKRVVAATCTGQIFEIDAASGAERMLVDLEKTIRCGPVILGKTIAVGLTNGSVVAVSSADGNTRFVTEARPQPTVGLTYAGDLLLAADDGGTLRAFNASSGSLVWKRETGHSTSAPPVAHNGLVVFATGKEAFILDAADGKIRARVGATAWVAGTPALAGGRLYVGDLAGVLSVFDVTSGSLLFRHRMEGVLRASPLILPEGVLIISDVGVVTLIGA
ncbi:MAG: PQQ-binding-like beta-propeller repeat protein, partial [Planctomycetota bacterium]